MGLFKSLRGKVDVGTAVSSPAVSTAHEQHQYEPPPGPPPSQVQQASNENTQFQFLPPPGPPPSRSNVAVSPSDPTSYSTVTRDLDHNLDQPQPQNENPPPYHDWTVIPDTALLPPPPPLPEDYSPTNNASYDSAARAHEWCAAHPVYTPSRPSTNLHALAARGEIALETPPRALLARGFTLQPLVPTCQPTSVDLNPLSASDLSTARTRAKTPSSTSQSRCTSWLIRTSPAQQDAIIISSIPLYFAAVDNPSLNTSQASLDVGHEQQKIETKHNPKVKTKSNTIYFEIVVHKIANPSSGVAIGFAAKPYPPWRLPGWHRASIGVHGDDGRRFVNDSWGGREFVEAFREGETIGVGMRFSASPSPFSKVKTTATAFITRQDPTSTSPDALGHRSWSWDIDEERDVRDEGVDGLMGDADLYAAIGVFGGVEIEVRFGPDLKWALDGA